MSTPLLDAANRYLAQGFSRFHMPGHKGRSLHGLEDIAHYDLTEVTGLDSLYESHGAIRQTEEAYTRLYGTSASLLSAGGSTLCIQTMLALAAKPGGKILAARGVHTAAINAMALLDLRPVWLYPEIDPVTGLSLAVSVSAVEYALGQNPDVAAVYLTSPTYFGVISDIEAIGTVCKAFGVPLLVDNAHGAHLKFLSPSLHPADLGADLCCDSLHKTLPVLTGGALLHICNPAFFSQAKRTMSLFGSTSPSYLVMLSADAALPYLENHFLAEAKHVTDILRTLSFQAKANGFLQPSGVCDPMRLTLGFAGLGYHADGFQAHLQEWEIEPEFLSDSFCVLMASPFNRPKDFERLQKAIAAAHPQTDAPVAIETFPPSEQVLSPREASFCQLETLPLEQACGRIIGHTVAPCPPGIPLLVNGERINAEAVRLLKNYGIRSVNVVK